MNLHDGCRNAVQPRARAMARPGSSRSRLVHTVATALLACAWPMACSSGSNGSTDSRGAAGASHADGGSHAQPGVQHGADAAPSPGGSAASSSPASTSRFDASASVPGSMSMDASVQDGSSSAMSGDARDVGTDAASNASVVDGGACSGMTPMCLAGCGGDQLLGSAQCIAGAWQCAQGVLPKGCPASTCFGVPARGETCVDGQWQCHPDADAFTRCPALMCATCTGWDGPVDQAGCHCACMPNKTVTCTAM